jgi:hypothetical protein
MSGPSLWWIDWRLAGAAKVREGLGRFALLLVLGAFLLAMLLSGGVNRLLSEQWFLTAVLGSSVPDGEGEGIAGKLDELPAVRSAVYRSPDAAWGEFVKAYPGLESLRQAGGNPLPGYVEIRLRPDRLTEADIAHVAAVLRPLPQVEKILSGGEALPALLRLSRWANMGLWAGVGLLGIAVLAIFRIQERTRAAVLASDFAFLEERGISGRRIALRRAAASALVGGLQGALAVSAAAVALRVLTGRYSLLRLAVGFPEDAASPAILVPAGLFVLAAALAAGAATLLGMRAAGRDV